MHCFAPCLLIHRMLRKKSNDEGKHDIVSSSECATMESLSDPELHERIWSSLGIVLNRVYLLLQAC